MAQLKSAEELLLVSELPGVEIFRHQRFSFLNQLQVDDLSMMGVYGIHVYVWRYIYILTIEVIFAAADWFHSSSCRSSSVLMEAAALEAPPGPLTPLLLFVWAV